MGTGGFPRDQRGVAFLPDGLSGLEYHGQYEPANYCQGRQRDSSERSPDRGPAYAPTPGPYILDDIHGRIVNATCLISEIAGSLAEQTGTFGVCYFDRSDGKRQFSIRSRNEGKLDVSLIAQRRGGGGHKSAAGWQEDTP